MRNELDLDQGLRPSASEYGKVSYRGCIEGLPYSEDEMIGRLLRITGNLPLRRAYESEKVTFEIVGRFRGHYFCLYDYKGGRSIHVGGAPEIELLVPLLRDALIARCATLRSIPFQAVGIYDEYPIRRGLNVAQADFRFTPPYPEVL